MAQYAANLDYETGTVTDEYGDEWGIIADDGCGHIAVERDGGDNDRWHAGQFSDGTLYTSEEGATFGVNCQDEYIVERVDNAGSLRWVENEE